MKNAFEYERELAALWEELATSNEVGTAIGETLGRVTAERDDLHKRLTAAEQRNAVLEEALKEIADIEDELYGGDWDEIKQARDIANAALKPTE